MSDEDLHLLSFGEKTKTKFLDAALFSPVSFSSLVLFEWFSHGFKMFFVGFQHELYNILQYLLLCCCRIFLPPVQVVLRPLLAFFSC